MAASKVPPPLPSRNPPATSSSVTEEGLIDSNQAGVSDHDQLPPPPYQQTEPWYGAIHSGDPRTSSTDSLVPSSHENESRRRLLVIYIHGFYGNDQSFRSFPAHLHAYLSAILSDSHVIHSKIYPRYKTYRAIEIARDNFSAWLEPHESPTTDVILVGHSMGGLLAAEVVLMRNQNPQIQYPFKHRILGTVSLDSPFLGLHPGIVITGISSLFAPAPTTPSTAEQDSSLQQQTSAASSSSIHLESQSQVSLSTISSYAQQPGRQERDPFYDPPFFNDEPFREKPFVKRVMNFASKHKADGLFNAMGNHIMSHFEFGGCLADFHGLAVRYNKLRALENVDELRAIAEGHPAGAFARVRFVNYYTLSSGRPKLPVEEKPDTEKPQEPLGDIASLSLIEKEPLGETTKEVIGDDDKTEKQEKPATVATQSIQEIKPSSSSSTDNDEERAELQQIVPEPMAEEEVRTQIEEDAETKKQNLPPIPSPPASPTQPDFTQFTDKETRKQVEKEYKRQQKSHEQAIKNRDKAIRERTKLLEKIRKEEIKDLERAKKTAQKEQAQRDKAEKKKQTQAASQKEKETDGEQPKKLRKFCTLPSKVNGVRDDTWVDVYMEGMDEVAAHCGLFLPGPQYDGLIAGLGDRVASWVHEDMSKRLALELLAEETTIPQ